VRVRRLRLQIALMLQASVDLTFILGIFANSILSRDGASATSVAVTVLLGAALFGSTIALARAWRRAPRPGAAPTKSE
jgi:hypothetical protein